MRNQGGGCKWAWGYFPAERDESAGDGPVVHGFDLLAEDTFVHPPSTDCGWHFGPLKETLPVEPCGAEVTCGRIDEFGNQYNWPYLRRMISESSSRIVYPDCEEVFKKYSEVPCFGEDMQSLEGYQEKDFFCHYAKNFWEPNSTAESLAEQDVVEVDVIATESTKLFQPSFLEFSLLLDDFVSKHVPAEFQYTGLASDLWEGNLDADSRAKTVFDALTKEDGGERVVGNLERNFKDGFYRRVWDVVHLNRTNTRGKVADIQNYCNVIYNNTFSCSNNLLQSSTTGRNWLYANMKKHFPRLDTRSVFCCNGEPENAAYFRLDIQGDSHYNIAQVWRWLAWIGAGAALFLGIALFLAAIADPEMETRDIWQLSREQVEERRQRARESEGDKPWSLDQPKESPCRSLFVVATWRTLQIALILFACATCAHVFGILLGVGLVLGLLFFIFFALWLWQTIFESIFHKMEAMEKSIRRLATRTEEATTEVRTQATKGMTIGATIFAVVTFIFQLFGLLGANFLRVGVDITIVRTGFAALFPVTLDTLFGPLADALEAVRLEFIALSFLEFSGGLSTSVSMTSAQCTSDVSPQDCGGASETDSFGTTFLLVRGVAAAASLLLVQSGMLTVLPLFAVALEQRRRAIPGDKTMQHFFVMCLQLLCTGSIYLIVLTTQSAIAIITLRVLLLFRRSTSAWDIGGYIYSVLGNSIIFLAAAVFAAGTLLGDVFFGALAGETVLQLAAFRKKTDKTKALDERLERKALEGDRLAKMKMSPRSQIALLQEHEGISQKEKKNHGEEENVAVRRIFAVWLLIIQRADAVNAQTEYRLRKDGSAQQDGKAFTDTCEGDGPSECKGPGQCPSRDNLYRQMDLTRQELVDVLTVLATVFSFWTPTALRVQNVEKISELLLNMGRSKDFPVPGLDYDETLLEEKEEKKKKKCGKVENIMAAAIIKVLTRAFSVVYLLVPGFGTFAGKFLERLGDGPVVLDFFMLRQLRKQLMEKVQGSKDQMKQAKQEAKTKAKEKFKEFTNDAGQKWPQYLRTVLAWNNILSIALTASFPRAVTVYIAVGLTSINEIINHILSSEFLNYDRAVSIGIDKFSRAKKEIGTTLTEDLEGVTEAVGVPNTQVIQVRSRAEDENPLAGALNADSGGAVPSAAGLAEENLAENLPGVPSE